jgi:chromosome segregation ATPase
MAKIETGVDKLVELVTSQKKIALDDAAKELGVSTAVVQEWAEFLEEEGLVGIEYTLSKTYLVEKKLSKHEVEKKSHDYEQKKEAFVRKVDSTLKQLERDTSGFEDIKRAYNALKGDIGDQIDQVKEELDQMKHYETLKQSIDQDIIQQKVDYEKMVDDVHRKLYAEEKRYEKLLHEIKEEETKLGQERDEFKSLEDKEGSLKTRLEALQEVVRGIDSELGTTSKSITSEEGRLSRLHEIAQTIERDIRRKKAEELDPLMVASKEHGEKILQVQESILKKVGERKQTVAGYEKEARDIVQKFDVFFKKRMETEKLLNDLEQQKAEMGHDLEGLKQKALAFNLLNKAADVRKQVGDLEKEYHEFDRKKSTFQDQLEKLRNVIGGKE